MKTNRILTTAIILLISSLPAFAANSDKIPGATVQDAAFFTGKPYDADLESYVFNYRNYNAEAGRWTTADPSGFPDGANVHAYAPNPLSEIDWCGLLAIVPDSSYQDIQKNSGILMTGISWIAKTKKNNVITVFEMKKVLDPAPTPNDFTMNCHGYVFLPGYWISNDYVATILADEWTVTDEKHAKIVVYGSSEHSAKVTGHNSTGNISEVTGKNGYAPVTTSSLNGTGYTGPAFYE